MLQNFIFKKEKFLFKAVSSVVYYNVRVNNIYIFQPPVLPHLVTNLHNNYVNYNDEIHAEGKHNKIEYAQLSLQQFHIFFL